MTTEAIAISLPVSIDVVRKDRVLLVDSSKKVAERGTNPADQRTDGRRAGAGTAWPSLASRAQTYIREEPEKQSKEARAAS